MYHSVILRHTSIQNMLTVDQGVTSIVTIDQGVTDEESLRLTDIWTDIQCYTITHPAIRRAYKMAIVFVLK